MAFSESREINSVRNSEVNGCMDLEGITIQETADLIMTAASRDNTYQNAKNILNVFGNIKAWMLNANCENEKIAKANINHMKVMYTYWAGAIYKGYKVEFRTYAFNKENRCV